MIQQLMRFPVLVVLFLILTVLSLFVGVSQVSITQIFHLTQEQQNILVSSRIPRTVSIVISGSSLALAGLIMQQMKKRQKMKEVIWIV